MYGTLDRNFDYELMGSNNMVLHPVVWFIECSSANCSILSSVFLFDTGIVCSVSDSVSGSFSIGPTGKGENSEGLIVNLLARSGGNSISLNFWAIFSGLFCTSLLPGSGSSGPICLNSWALFLVYSVD